MEVRARLQQTLPLSPQSQAESRSKSASWQSKATDSCARTRRKWEEECNTLTQRHAAQATWSWSVSCGLSEKDVSLVIERVGECVSRRQAPEGDRDLEPAALPSCYLLSHLWGAVGSELKHPNPRLLPAFRKLSKAHSLSSGLSTSPPDGKRCTKSWLPRHYQHHLLL